MAALTLLFLLIAGLFFGGVAYALFPTGHSRILGWAFLGVSTTVMVVEMNRWVKVLPGLLGLAVLNGLISILSGHVLANPNEPIPRIDALIVTVFFGAGTALAWTFKGRSLTVVDRVSLMAFAFTLPLWMGHDSYRAVVPGKVVAEDRLDLIIGGAALCFLLVPWIYDRVRGGARHRVVMSTTGR